MSEAIVLIYDIFYEIFANLSLFPINIDVISIGRLVSIISVSMVYGINSSQLIDNVFAILSSINGLDVQRVCHPSIRSANEKNRQKILNHNKKSVVKFE